MDKKNFPIFKNNPEITYLDNAATTQKPDFVINVIKEYYEKYNANVHRGIHKLSELATSKYEESRETVAKFLNADVNEIIFTSGTTDSINSLVGSLFRSHGNKKDKNTNEKIQVLATELEHHSNYLPWSVNENVEMTFMKLDDNFQIDYTDLAKLSKEKDFDFVAVTMMSNVTGTAPDIKKIRALFPESILVVDAAQAVAHMSIDVKELGIDFLAFSGHKIYAPTGIGVLYGKAELLKMIPPVKYGGGMITEVTKGKALWADIPEKHEAGTPNIEGAIGLKAAIDYINKSGFKKIQRKEELVRKYLLGRLKEIKKVHVFHPSEETFAGPVVSFAVDNVHPHDIAQILADNGVAVRAGHHCAQILHRDVLKQISTVRASIGMYNDKNDIDKLVEAINQAIAQFQS